MAADAVSKLPSLLSYLGAGAFGVLIGWYVYYINRYRKGDVQLGDITTLAGVLGGGVATTLFSPTGELFGAYGIGLFIGFFGYFTSLIYLVERSQNFDSDWFLDGRRKIPVDPYYIPDGISPTIRPMDIQIARQASAVDTSRPSQVPLAQTSTPDRAQDAIIPSLVPLQAAADLDQRMVDGCVSLKLRNSRDIHVVFGDSGGFIDWYNQTLSKRPEFSGRGKINSGAAVRDRFNAFWNQIPEVFEKPEISAIEFCALMSIGIQENSGDLWANPEKIGNAAHPGLSYAFDKIPGKKQSYNHANGNWTARKLFGDRAFLAAHRGLPGAAHVLQNGISPEWEGETWPAGFQPAVDPAINGFIMEADFFKFRGRGIIQTTGRDDYKPLIDFVINDPQAQANPTLGQIAANWGQAAQSSSPGDLLDTIATISSNRDWDTAFGESEVLAAGIRIDSKGKKNYLRLSHDAGILNAGTATMGSLYFMARKINGGAYPDEVVPMMKAMIRATAQLTGDPEQSARQSRMSLDDQVSYGIDAWPMAIRPWEELSPNIGDDEAAQPTNDILGVDAPVTQWRAAKSLLVLRDQVNQRSPNRRKGNDGTIGDISHQSRQSDHNPWIRDGGIGVVTAMDITHDPANGCDAAELAERIRDSRDSRVKYLIWNKQIANSLPQGTAPAWAWRPYHGSNPHDHHIHISVKSEKSDYDSTAQWSI